jgi:hypothetical protein
LNEQDQDIGWSYSLTGEQRMILWTVGQPDPVTKDDCKKGGWEAFGFRNQGQCIRFIETGKDSR